MRSLQNCLKDVDMCISWYIVSSGCPKWNSIDIGATHSAQALNKVEQLEVENDHLSRQINELKAQLYMSSAFEAAEPKKSKSSGARYLPYLGICEKSWNRIDGLPNWANSLGFVQTNLCQDFG